MDLQNRTNFFGCLITDHDLKLFNALFYSTKSKTEQDRFLLMFYVTTKTSKIQKMAACRSHEKEESV